MVLRFALVTFGIISFFSKITVNGPGQNLSIIFCATSGTSLTNSEISFVLTWIIRGLSCGLPLAIKIFLTASSSNALAPNPYTVSVGKATVPPFLITFPASSINLISVFISFIMATFVYIKI